MPERNDLFSRVSSDTVINDWFHIDYLVLSAVVTL
jgi:hypothetical protein